MELCDAIEQNLPEECSTDLLILLKKKKKALHLLKTLISIDIATVQWNVVDIYATGVRQSIGINLLSLCVRYNVIIRIQYLFI